jgi:ABC-type multidrug transport system fused ATPase/permease subunit
MKTPAHTPLIVENLTFSYRDREETAIRDISFSANPGEVLLVAGGEKGLCLAVKYFSKGSR